MDERCLRFLTRLRGDRTLCQVREALGHPRDLFGDWEAGRREPSASEVLRCARLLGADVLGGLRAFDARAADALVDLDDESLARWMSCVCEGIAQRRLALDCGRPVAVVRRWLSGRVRPRFGELIALIDAATGRGQEALDALLPSMPALEARSSPPPVPQDTPAATAPAPALRVVPTPVPAPPREPEIRARARDALLEARRVARGAEPPPTPSDLADVADLPEDHWPEEDDPTEEIVRPPTPAPHLRVVRTPADPPATRTASPLPAGASEVWQAMHSPDYARLGSHRPGFLAARAGLHPTEESAVIEALRCAGACRWHAPRWQALGARPDAPRAPSSGDPLERLAASIGAPVVLSLSDADAEIVPLLCRRTPTELAVIEASSWPKDQLIVIRPTSAA